jgi:hypothetical protein
MRWLPESKPQTGGCPDCGHDWAEHIPPEPCSEYRYEIEHQDPDAHASACERPIPG